MTDTKLFSHESVKLKKVLFFLVPLILLMVTVGSQVQAGPLAVETGIMQVRYPANSEPLYSKRDTYFVELLQLALKKSATTYSLESLPLPTMTAERSETLLNNGQYDVHWLVTDKSHEGKLLPIRIPLYKGLIGWRLMLIRKEDQAYFSDLETVDELKSYTAGQRRGGSDADILMGNDFNLGVASDRNGLLQMLEGHQIDYFPHSVIDIWEELEALPTSNFEVEEQLMLQYPSAYYFFVNKNNPALAAAIEKGLNLAVADGSFDEVFMRYFTERLKRAGLHKRKLLMISNPILSNETPLNRPELWFSLSDMNVFKKKRSRKK